MKVTIKNEAQKEALIQVIKNTEIKCNYRAEFTKVRRKRSLSQNAYMWTCIACMSEYNGDDATDLYDMYLDLYPTRIEKMMFDEICTFRISSSKFDTKQMSIFIENIRRHMAQNGVPTPEPGTDKAIEMFNYYKDKGLI